jgi:hypothetical protein
MGVRAVALDLTGHKYNLLTVVEFSHKIGYKLYWKCVCECGGQTIVQTSNLRKGNVKSCGCLKILASIRNAKATATHNMSKTPEWKTWKSLRSRCKDKNNPDYGGRGISYTPRWEVFLNFLEDMGFRPEGASLDRIDPNGNYCKENCRWATHKEQMRNRRITRRLKFPDGSLKSLSQAADELGISKTAAQYYFSVALKMKELYGILPNP